MKVDLPGSEQQIAEWLVEFATGAVAKGRDEVSVAWSVEGPRVHFLLKVPNEEIGKVVGKQGRIVKALRLLLHSLAAQNGCAYTLEIAQ